MMRRVRKIIRSLSILAIRVFSLLSSGFQWCYQNSIVLFQYLKSLDREQVNTLLQDGRVKAGELFTAFLEWAKIRQR